MYLVVLNLWKFINFKWEKIFLHRFLIIPLNPACRHFWARFYVRSRINSTSIMLYCFTSLVLTLTPFNYRLQTRRLSNYISIFQSCLYFYSFFKYVKEVKKYKNICNNKDIITKLKAKPVLGNVVFPHSWIWTCHYLPNMK